MCGIVMLLSRWFGDTVYGKIECELAQYRFKTVNSSSAWPYSFTCPLPKRPILSGKARYPDPVFALKSPKTAHASLLATVLTVLSSLL